MWKSWRVVSASLFMSVCLWGCDDPEDEVIKDNASTGGADMGARGGDMSAEVDQGSEIGQFEDCPVAARPIYVIDADGFKLLSFDPQAMAFTEVGSVANCPTQVQGATPFSMAVDRNADAWVLYNSGEMFLYSIQNKDCIATRFRANSEFALFGMGFVRDWPDHVDEDILYIAGDGSGPGDEELSSLGQIDFVDSTYERIAGPLAGDPELTGTASGELWGFFPETDPAQVAQIDRATGAIGTNFPIPQITDQANAWAFAFWGGEFWVFYKGGEDPSTRVIRVRPESGEVTEVISDTGYLIVGAGVSTCAPLEYQ